MTMTLRQEEDAKAFALSFIRNMLRGEDYGAAATAVQLFKRAAPQLGHHIERKMPALVMNNSPAFTGARAMGAMRWTGRTPDWHDQLRRHAASPRLAGVVERIADEIDRHESGD